MKKTLIFLGIIALVVVVYFAATVDTMVTPAPLSTKSFKGECPKDGIFENSNRSFTEVRKKFEDAGRISEKQDDFLDFMLEHKIICNINDDYQLVIKSTDAKNLYSYNLFLKKRKDNKEHIIYLSNDKSSFFAEWINSWNYPFLNLNFELRKDNGLLEIYFFTGEGMKGTSHHTLVKINSGETIWYKLYSDPFVIIDPNITIYKDDKELNLYVEFEEKIQNKEIGKLGELIIKGITINNSIVRNLEISENVLVIENPLAPNDSSLKGSKNLYWRVNFKNIYFSKDLSKLFLTPEFSFYKQENSPEIVNLGEIELAID